MKRKIKVSASFQGVLPVASYANVRPAFGAEEEFEVDIENTGDLNEIIETRQRELQSICFRSFEQEAIKAKVAKISADRKDFRFYKLPSGEEVPSVTSIINYDSEFLVDGEELKQYAAQSNINHARVAEYITTGIWKDPKDMEGIVPDMFIVKKGSLGLDYDACDFPEFEKKFPVKELKNGRVLLNEVMKYGGTSDGECLYEGVPTLFDIKRTADKVKNFQQIAAYAKCSGMEHIKQMMIIVLNDKTERGFSKPIISTDIDKYFELFCFKRKEFRKVYDI